jgi:hypothetical protein
VARQRREIQTLQKAGIGTTSAEELLGRMLAKVDELCASATVWLASSAGSIPAPTRSSTGRSSGVSDDLLERVVGRLIA